MTTAKIQEIRDFANSITVTPEWPESEPAAETLIDASRLLLALCDEVERRPVTREE